MSRDDHAEKEDCGEDQNTFQAGNENQGKR